MNNKVFFNISIIKKDDVKYGLWENGRRIKWFTPDEVSKINEGTLNYADFFELPKSKDEMPSGLGFEPPTNFDTLVSVVKTSFPEIEQENQK